jgi:hypothetical protein
MIMQEFNELMKRVHWFRSIDNARSFACGCDKTHMIVMGDVDENGGWYWVSVPAVTEKLNRAGYEYVR